jgi:hypothetical protein
MDELEAGPAGGAYEEALEGALHMARRLALLHMAYARTLVDALGEEAGRALIERAIRAYGERIGERTRRRVEALGLEPTPENFREGSDLSQALFPTRAVEVEGEARSRSMGCVLYDIWREYGEEALGALYCLVDPAKMEGYHPDWTMVHTQRLPLGDACCEMAVRPTSPRDAGTA